MEMDLTKLRTFREVARTGSFTAAGHRLSVTTSAVSHAIRRLTESVGTDLIEWKGRKLFLTDDGEYLYQVCQRVFDDIEEAGRRLTTGSGGATHRIVLGSTIEFGITVLLPRLRKPLAIDPLLHVDFIFSNELESLLLSDGIDMAVDCRQHTHSSIHCNRMFREKYAVIASPGFLQRHPVRNPMDLSNTPVLSLDREGEWWDKLLGALPAKRRPVLRDITMIDNVRGMIDGATAEYGVALVPKYAVLDKLSEGSLVLLFPRLALLEDAFSIYQRTSRMERYANRTLTRFLLGLDVSGFGDAMSGDS